MKRMHRMVCSGSLTALIVALAAGCTTAPQRRNVAPQTSPPAVQHGAVSSTTGDADQCARALGNSVLGTTPGTTGTIGTEITANGLLIGNIALVGLPTTDHIPTSPSASTVVPNPTGGPTVVGTTPRTGTAPTTVSAIDRIRAACPMVVEVRTAANAADRARLAEVSASIRKGASVNGFLDDVMAINKRATSVWVSAARTGG